jgi:hypothetical protein
VCVCVRVRAWVLRARLRACLYLCARRCVRVSSAPCVCADGMGIASAAAAVVAAAAAANLGQEVAQQILAVGLAFCCHVAVFALPAVPAAAQVLQEDGRARGEELEEVFSIQAAHGTVR